jgi:hypothetical protein
VYLCGGVVGEATGGWMGVYGRQVAGTGRICCVSIRCQLATAAASTHQAAPTNQHPSPITHTLLPAHTHAVTYPSSWVAPTPAPA